MAVFERWWPVSGRARTLAVVLATLWLGACNAGQAAPNASERAQPPARPRYVETREVITHLAGDLMRIHEVTGVSLALVDEGEVVWATGWGFADADRKLAAGPRTVYNVGSLSKPVTTAAVMQAVERGDLALDQTLAQLLPDLDLAGDAEQQITLAQLLSHQSGLPSDWFVHDLSETPPPWIEIVEEIRGLELAQPIGAQTLYSNLGMTLAGAALARARGVAFEQLVTEELLRPAGMRTAHFPAGPEPEPVLLPIAGAPRGLAAAELSASYRHDQARVDPQFRMNPAGGLRASVLDLAAFAGVVLGHGQLGTARVLGPESVAALLRPHNDGLEFDLDQRFGYGWFLDHPELDWVGRVAWHGGRTYYHHAQMILLPDHGLAVVVASNSLTAGPVVEALAVEALLSALQEKHGIEPPVPPGSVEHHVAPAELVAAFDRAHAGEYATSTGISTVGALASPAPDPNPGADTTAGTKPDPRVQEIWSCTANGRSRLTLDQPDGGTLEAASGTRISFLEVGDDHMMVLEHDGVRRPSGVRLGPPPPIPAAWIARTGAWTVLERPGEASIVSQPQLRVVAGRLQFEYVGLLDEPPLTLVMVLEPLDDRRARIAGRGRGQGTIVEVRGEGDEQRLWWAGREFQRVADPTAIASP